MNSQAQILQKENQKDMLECQFASRVCFNRAEKLNYIAWLLSIPSALLILPLSFNEELSIALPLIIAVFTLIARKIARYYVEWGARLRNYFDSKVLDIGATEISKEEHSLILEKVQTIANKYPDECRTAINTDDQADIPGVKNWYTFSRKYTSNESAVFECQRQNYWWTDKQFLYRKIIYSIILVILALAVTVGIYYSPVKTIFCLISLILNLYDDISENIRAWKIMQSVKTIVALPGIENNSSQISRLQTYIEKRRGLLVLEINSIHRKFAKQWAKLYKVRNADDR